MDEVTFDQIKVKHGAYASWAVWAEPDRGPKSNIGDLSVLDPAQNLTLLDTLRNNVVMLGLNISRPASSPFANFHDARPQGQDYKIRYAFSGTPYYGAYMTDLIKGAVEPESGNLLKLLNSDPSLISKGIGWLLEEFEDLACSRPTLIAFGADTYRLAARHMPSNSYGRLVRVTHYSHYISKENYRQRVLEEVDSVGTQG
jgi:hypothetical protein